MRNSRLIVIALLLAAAACQPTGKGPPPVGTAGPSGLSGPGPCAFWDGLDGGLGRWMVQWRKLVPRLDCQAFEASEAPATSLLALPGADRSAALAAAPRRWRSRDGARVALVSSDAGSPDSFVDVLSTGPGTVQRVASCGPACGWTDAAWLPDGRLVVAGWSEWHPPAGEPRCVGGARCTFVATLTVITVDTGEARAFHGPEVDEAAFAAWRAAR